MTTFIRPLNLALVVLKDENSEAMEGAPGTDMFWRTWKEWKNSMQHEDLELLKDNVTQVDDESWWQTIHYSVLMGQTKPSRGNAQSNLTLLTMFQNAVPCRSAHSSSSSEG
jgi:hypothetical protein